MQQTVDWLDGHDIPYWDLCFLADKSAVGANLYVEDSPRNVEQLRAEGHPTIVFTSPTNRHLPGPRADTWEQVFQMVTAEMQAAGSRRPELQPVTASAVSAFHALDPAAQLARHRLQQHQVLLLLHADLREPLLEAPIQGVEAEVERLELRVHPTGECRIRCVVWVITWCAITSLLSRPTSRARRLHESCPTVSGAKQARGAIGVRFLRDPAGRAVCRMCVE